MIDSILIIGCILFFILLTYSFQMRNRLYKNYPTSCHVTYIPEKDKIPLVDNTTNIKFEPDSSYFTY